MRLLWTIKNRENQVSFEMNVLHRRILQVFHYHFRCIHVYHSYIGYSVKNWPIMQFIWKSCSIYFSSGMASSWNFLQTNGILRRGSWMRKIASLYCHFYVASSCHKFHNNINIFFYDKLIIKKTFMQYFFFHFRTLILHLMLKNKKK